ncbi:rhamnose mutarotase [Gautieria morchelliformis]|nr:rhamnose mutarotase [Gautieria morchelliformis]
MSSSKSHSGKRICQVIAVKKQYLEEYKKMHTDVWETVLNGLRRSHIIDYSIHFLPSPPFAIMGQSEGDEIGGLLVATFKYMGQDFDGDMKRAALDEETRRWWKVTDGMQHSFVEGAKGSADGEWWYMCEEVFRFDR